MDEKELLYKCKQSDPEAFNQLVLRYQDRIFNLAYRLLGHYQEAEDVCQQSFINAYYHIKNFQEKSSFLTWVYKITVNLCYSAQRKRSRQPVSIPLQGNEFPAETNPVQNCPPSDSNPVNFSNNPGQQLENNERNQTVQKALNLLEENLRTVVILRDIEGHSYAEISRILNQPVGTIRSRLAKAREELKMRLLKNPIISP
ncbi:MAG: RNA polymerase sigma factor [Planctomycetota bacterium]